MRHEATNFMQAFTTFRKLRLGSDILSSLPCTAIGPRRSLHGGACRDGGTVVKKQSKSSRPSERLEVGTAVHLFPAPQWRLGALPIYS